MYHIQKTNTMTTKEINFVSNGTEYHATVMIFSDKTYEVTECYRFDDEIDSVDVDYRQFISKIEEQIADDIRSDERDYGGCKSYLHGLKQSYY